MTSESNYLRKEIRSIVLVCNDASDVQELLRITFGYVGTMGKSWFFVDILTLQTTFCGHKRYIFRGVCPFFFSKTNFATAPYDFLEKEREP
jgi:hypothetical protein